MHKKQDLGRGRPDLDDDPGEGLGDGGQDLHLCALCWRVHGAEDGAGEMVQVVGQHLQGQQDHHSQPVEHVVHLLAAWT